MVYEISEAKAIMGAAFIHYVVYCVFYSIDAIKMASSDEPEKESADPKVKKAKEKAEKKKNDPKSGSPAKAPGQSTTPNDNFGGARPGAGLGMDEINVKVDIGEEKKQEQPGIGPGPRQPEKKLKRPEEEDDEGPEDLDGYDDDGLPFFTQIVNRYPKSIIWYFMVMAFAGARAATPFGIAMAYLSLIGRAVQIIGAFTNKPIVSYIGYGFAVLMLICLYFNVMVHEG